MKHILIISISLSCVLSSPYAQKSTSVSPIKEIKIGDKMPDISLGTVVNNNTGKKKFSEFKGKFIILDFWNSFCGSCIDCFPKLEKLQNQFKDRVQFFLVNPDETQEQIEKRLPPAVKRKFPNIPSIVDAKKLNELFPHLYIGHQVWINEKGIVIMEGHSSLNANEVKIKEALLGKSIAYIRDDVTYDNSKPVYQLLNHKDIASPLLYNSFFSKFNNDLAGADGGLWKNIIDSANGTVRNTFVNRDVLDLYYTALGRFLKQDWDEKQIYIKNTSFYLSERFSLSIHDTLKYTYRSIPFRDVTDKIFSQSVFCYEQVTPINLTDDRRMDYMLSDLNRYFGDLYGVTGSIEKEKIKCYVLVRTSDQDKLKTKSSTKKNEQKNFIENGKKMVRYENNDLVSIINGLADKAFRDFKRAILLNETNYKNKIDITVPVDDEIHSLEDIRQALHPYDLDIIQKELDLNVIVLREKL